MNKKVGLDKERGRVYYREKDIKLENGRRISEYKHNKAEAREEQVQTFHTRGKRLSKEMFIACRCLDSQPGDSPTLLRVV